MTHETTTKPAKPVTSDEPSGPERLAAIHALLAELFSGPVIPELVELVMAGAISQRVVPHGPPLWLLLEGAASSGKTSAVNLLKPTAKEPGRLSVFATRVTLGSLSGGFKDSKGRRAPALLKEFDTRCWCNTELGALLSGDPKTVKATLGLMTAAFDGELPSALGNLTEQSSAVLDLTCRFSLIGCVTPAVRQEHAGLMAKLGPRFLSYRLMALTDAEQRAASKLSRDPRREAGLKKLGTLVSLHVRDALKEAAQVHVSEEAEVVLELLARLVAHGRAPVDSWGKTPTVGDVENTTRVYQQLRVLLVALACVHGSATPSPRALRLVRDVALSSFEPRRAEALMAQRMNPVLAFYPPTPGTSIVYVHGMTAPWLADETGWSEDKAKRVLAELTVLELYVEADPRLRRLDTPERGPAPALYVPAPGLACVLNTTFDMDTARLITLPEMFWADPGAFDGRLSPPDARLAALAAERRAELEAHVRGVAQKVVEAHPDLTLEQASLLMFRGVTGVDLVGKSETPVSEVSA